jgi:quinoprotein glucose dehydrogenase
MAETVRAQICSRTLVAVNAETGKRIWHFQTVHHELWDYDLPPSPVLFDLVKDGRTIPALAEISKAGSSYSSSTARQALRSRRR